MLHEVTFGQWLKKRRSALDLTQQRLADRVGCSVETIYKIEAGQRRPSRQIAALLAAQFGIPDQERGAFITFARATASMAFLNPEAASAPWRTQFLPPHNLPTQLTSFIGREHDLVTGRTKLLREDVRLLTIVGPPGVGKTRLSLRLGEKVLLDFPDGVFFVELAQITNFERIASTIAQTVGIMETGGRSPLDSLKQALFERHLLLILDNFEHLTEAAPTVVSILVGCPLVKIVVTSRAPLRIRGEWLLPLMPLDLPPEDTVKDADRLLDWAAIRLFVERAQAIEPAFNLTTDNADAIAAICVRLDGLPLAIEIISARVQVLPLAALLKSIGGSQLLLSEGTRDAEARHQTLKAAIDWSYHLLGESDQRDFRSLGIFRKGYTLAAAEAVCESAVSMLDSLVTLVQMNLVKRVMTAPDVPRFDMLETIHEYAMAQLTVHEETEALARRHAAYFLQFALNAEPELRRANQGVWLEKLEHDHSNLLAALHFYQLRHRWKPALQLAGALFEFWVYRGHLLEGLDVMDALLSSAPDDEDLLPMRAKVLNGAAMLTDFAGDHAAAFRYSEQALAVATRVEDDWNIAFASMSIGMTSTWRQDFETAEKTFNRGLEAAHRLDEKWLIATLLTGLGEVARLQADYERALAYYERGLALVREIGHLWIGAHLLSNIGLVAYAQGQYDRANAAYRESLMNSIQLSDERGIAMAVEKLGGVSFVRGQPERAAKLFGAAAVLRKRKNAPGDPDEVDQRQAFIRLIRSQLDETTFAAAWQDGEAMPIEQAIAFALDNQR